MIEAPFDAQRTRPAVPGVTAHTWGSVSRAPGGRHYIEREESPQYAKSNGYIAHDRSDGLRLPQRPIYCPLRYVHVKKCVDDQRGGSDIRTSHQRPAKVALANCVRTASKCTSRERCV